MTRNEIKYTLSGFTIGSVFFVLIYLLGKNQSYGDSVLFFDFSTALIPAMISSLIEPTGKYDVLLIYLGGYIEFAGLASVIGYFIGKNR